jgi:hypothetical protein
VIGYNVLFELLSAAALCVSYDSTIALTVLTNSCIFIGLCRKQIGAEASYPDALCNELGRLKENIPLLLNPSALPSRIIQIRLTVAD